MLSSLILSLTMSTSPAPVIESNDVFIEQAGTKRNQVRIGTKRNQVRIGTKRNQVRIDMVNPEILEAGTKRNQVRIGTKRNQVRI